MDLQLCGVFCLLTVWLAICTSFISARFIEASSSVSCACNTQECRSQGSNRCMATNMCYVQYVPPTKRNRPAQRAKKDNYIRGCINRSTPLLCENRPPSLLGSLRSEWPILHCCSSDMCNKNVLPTPPNWMPTTTHKPFKQDKGEEVKQQQQQLDDITSHSPSSRAGERLLSGGEESLIISAAAADPDHDPEVTLESSHIGIILNKIPISPSEEGRDRQQEDDEMQTSILVPDNNNILLPASSSNADTIFSSSRLLYIGVPIVSVLLLVMLVVVGVVALRRAQYVSTENLVQRPKNFIHIPASSCHPGAGATSNTSSLHSLKKKYPSPMKMPPRQNQGHDHVSYISASSLDDCLPDAFYHYLSFSDYSNRRL